MHECLHDGVHTSMCVSWLCTGDCVHTRVCTTACVHLHDYARAFARSRDCGCVTTRVRAFALRTAAYTRVCTHACPSPPAPSPARSQGEGKAAVPVPAGSVAGAAAWRVLPARWVLPRGGCCRAVGAHLVAAEADVEVVEVLEALGGEAGAAGEGGAGSQRREVVVQDAARQRQVEAAVVVAEGAELRGGRWQSGTAGGWHRPSGAARVGSVTHGRSRWCHPPCHPPRMARGPWCQLLGDSITHLHSVTHQGWLGGWCHPSRVRYCHPPCHPPRMARGSWCQLLGDS